MPNDENDSYFRMSPVEPSSVACARPYWVGGEPGTVARCDLPIGHLDESDHRSTTLDTVGRKVTVEWSEDSVVEADRWAEA